MLDALKGNALWAAVIIVLAIIGASTYLASQSILTGTDVLAILIPILTGVVGLGTAHVVGQATLAAGVSTVPAPPPPVAPSETVI